MTVMDDHPPAETLVELDPRKRVSLPMADAGRYLAHRDPDGTITLVPAVVLSKMEAAILRAGDHGGNGTRRSGRLHRWAPGSTPTSR